jgi:hypothetical protein
MMTGFIVQCCVMYYTTSGRLSFMPHDEITHWVIPFSPGVVLLLAAADSWRQSTLPSRGSNAFNHHVKNSIRNFFLFFSFSSICIQVSDEGKCFFQGVKVKIEPFFQWKTLVSSCARIVTAH